MPVKRKTKKLTLAQQACQLNPNGNPLYELYGGTVQLEFDKVKHWYFANGKYVPSVTGVTKYLDKSGPLMYWAVKQTVNYFRSQFVAGTVVDEVQLEKIFREALTQFRSHTKEAADVGSLIHAWIEDYINKKLIASPQTNVEIVMPLNARMQNGVKAFLNWEKDNQIEFIRSESKIYSKKYNYSGTCDLIAKVNGQLSVVDFKTGSGPYYEQTMQLAAYQNALEEELKLKFKERWLVSINKDTGELNTYECTLYKQDLDAFKALLKVYDRHLLGVLTPPKPKQYHGF